MGIGRREFIRIFGASLAAVAATPSDAVSLVDDLYLNRKLGMGFRRPDGWNFADVQEMGRVKKGQLLAIDDEVVAGKLLESMHLPFVSVVRRSETPEGFTPSAQFYVVDDVPALEEVLDLGDALERLLGEFTGNDEAADDLPSTLRKLHDDAKACKDFLRSFDVLSPPRRFQLSACDAAEYTASYLFEHSELAHPVRVRVRTIYVNHRIASYLIRLIDSPYGTRQDKFDFDAFVDSIRLV